MTVTDTAWHGDQLRRRIMIGRIHLHQGYTFVSPVFIPSHALQKAGYLNLLTGWAHFEAARFCKAKTIAPWLPASPATFHHAAEGLSLSWQSWDYRMRSFVNAQRVWTHSVCEDCVIKTPVFVFSNPPVKADVGLIRDLAWLADHTILCLAFRLVPQCYHDVLSCLWDPAKLSCTKVDMCSSNFGNCWNVQIAPFPASAILQCQMQGGLVYSLSILGWVRGCH